MITLSGMSKSYVVGREETSVFEDVTLTLPTDRRLAILGGENAGKSVLVRILSGVEEASQGMVAHYTHLSFPVGFIRAFRPQLTARQNVQHAARLYGADPDEVAAFVDGVTALGPGMDEQIRQLQLRDRVALAYAMSYAIPFDTYLVDENIAAGNPEFRDICHAMFAHRIKDSGLILATRQIKKARDFCDIAAVIVDRKLVLFDDMEEAFGVYQDCLAKAGPGRYAGVMGVADSSMDAA